MLQTEPGNGREEARQRYAVIARKYEPDVFRHALRLTTGNSDWASDLTQDALISGYTHCMANKLDFSGNIRAWLMRVVTTRFINEYRRGKKWNADVALEDLLEPSHLESDDPYVTGMFDEPLERALRQLPEDQRMCVLLVDIEEMSYQEASQLLEVPVGTVRSRLARARLRLYTLLMPYAKSKGIL
jgi:RNA polymerase sigma-70 factor (ECF subfamily)